MAKANKKAQVKSKVAAKEKSKSKSGKYKSVRHLLETLFFKNKELTKDEAKAVVKKEFPDSKYLRTTKTHFSWYKSHILNHREFVTIDPPSWAKGGPKIKVTKRVTEGEANN